MKIVITDAGTVTSGDIPLEELGEFGELTIYDGNAVGQELFDRIRDADIVLCNKTVIGKEEIDHAPKLKFIGLFATGYNNIDVEYARTKGITVSNAGRYSTMSVAQHVFALILEHYSRVSEYRDYVARGDWQKSRYFTMFSYPTMELCGKTIGIFGLGSIGRAVRTIAEAFGMNVIACSRTRNLDGVNYVDFDTLLETSDIITVHTPLTPETVGLFGKEAFAKMKDGAFFVNTARGGIVDEYALADALKTGKLSGAGLDVLVKEPQSPDCPLIGAPNLIVTPHIAWAPRETRLRLLGIVKNNISAFLAGRPENVVN
ncbi:MAG: D-2-hydroxyacid dehydrogenase [Clostridia bacterium]|nr:D-2-hydroxyacid dehydrogenase [Clostridia bacterium]